MNEDALGKSAKKAWQNSTCCCTSHLLTTTIFFIQPTICRADWLAPHLKYEPPAPHKREVPINEPENGLQTNINIRA